MGMLSADIHSRLFFACGVGDGGISVETPGSSSVLLDLNFVLTTMRYVLLNGGKSL